MGNFFYDVYCRYTPVNLDMYVPNGHVRCTDQCPCICR